MNLARLGQELNVQQLDLNPVFLYEHGLKVIDAKGIIGG